MSSDKIDFIALAPKGVQGLTPYAPGKPIDELERELGIVNSIKLASNENPCGASPKALEAAVASLSHVNLYPDGGGYYLSQVLAQRHGLNDEQVTLGNGSNDILELIARAFLSPESNSVFSQYAFVVYPMVTKAIGAQARIAPALGADSDMPCGHDLDAMLALIDDNTRVVFIANPNNPTGTHLTSAAIRAFLLAVPTSTIVVLDGAYAEYVDVDDYPDCSQWLAEFPNLIVTRTFSKAFALAGLRVGYSVSSAQVADLLNRVRQPFNVNIPAQAAAIEALKDEAHLATAVALNSAEKQRLVIAFNAMGLSCLPSQGNFLCVDFKREAMPIYEALLHKGVIVRPVANYGLVNYLRITIGSAAENDILLNQLQAVL